MWDRARKIIGEDISKFDVEIIGKARLGDEKAIFRIGKLYSEGLKIKENQEKAVKLFEICAEKGNIFAKTRLADCYVYGRGVNKDNDKAKELLSDPIKENDISACMLLGDIYKEEKEYKKAIEMYEKADEIYQEDNDKMDEYTMAIMYGDMAKLYLSEDINIYNPELGIEYLDKALKEGVFCNAKLAGDYLFKNKEYDRARYYYNIIANERMCDSCTSDCKDYCIQRLNSIEGNENL